MTLFQGHPCYIHPSVDRFQHQGVLLNTTVLVSNLSLAMNASSLEDMFSLVGNVRRAEVHLDAVTGKSQGFASVEMSTPEEAQNCVACFNGQKNDGLTLIVREPKI